MIHFRQIHKPAQGITQIMAVILLTGIILLNNNATAQQEGVNYDESKVAPYQPADPLVRKNGKKVTNSQEWIKYQRPHYLSLFARHVYGRYPSGTNDIRFETISIDSSALQGKAICKQVTIFFTASPNSPSMDLLIYLPNDRRNKQVSMFAGLNFYGNHAIINDRSIKLSTGWMRNNEEKGVVDHHATDMSRGTDSKWPIEKIIDRGYGVVTAYYGDLEPDHPDGWKTGIRHTLADRLKIQESEWAAIGAWAWGLSRILDYLEQDPAVNRNEVIITGHSRLGKAALWAAANDTRFAAVISNNSGEGGAALSKRWFGETIERINTNFPHWFVSAYKKYNDNVAALPVDQHQLLALMAPRPLYVASAENDPWADPRGEFLAASYAEKVYALFGDTASLLTNMPPVNQPLGKKVRYHIRTGDHDMTEYDWTQYIQFADDIFHHP